MKKMTFALACASTLALFAELPNTIGFEGYSWTTPATEFKGLSGKTDTGASAEAASSFWLYKGASGAEDGSAVKAYETVPSVSGVEFGDKFLELSTEGGTLWRSINNLGGSDALGTAQAIPADGNIFIDTMVQFTPTEDGNDDPGLGEGDKLAIWLDKATVDGQEVLSLKVRALSYTSEDLTTTAPATFTLARADGEPLVVDAESWHRLTVMAVPNVFPSTETYYMPAFTIKLDGNELRATTSPFTSAKATLIDPDTELLSAAMTALVSADRILPSLQGMLGEEQVAQLQAVGFKGSGKIDNLQFTTEDPNPGHADVVPVTGVALNQSSATLTVGETLTLTATVTPDNATDKTVTWSVTDGDAVTVEGGVVKAAKVGTATVTAKAGEQSAACTITVNAIAATATIELSATTAAFSDTLALPTVTVTADPAAATYTGAWDKELPTENPTGDYVMTYTVTFTGNYSGTAVTATFTVTPQAKKYPKYISEANQEAYDAWVERFSVKDRVDTDEDLLDAFLLNVAPADAEDEAGKFKITSITIDAEGNVTVVAPVKNSEGEDFNGTVEVKGAATVDAKEYTLKTTDPTAKFFKAFLVLEAPTAE